MSSNFLGIDVGSSATKGVIANSDGTKLCTFHKSLQTFFPANECVEQDPIEIWNSVAAIINEADTKFGALAGLGVCCQRSAVCAWNKEKIMHPLITWRDRRWLSLIEKLRANSSVVHSKTGLPITVHYAATKIAALQKQFPDAFVGTLDTFLCYKLIGDYLSDETSAAGSMLYNLETRDWDYYLCAIFDCDHKRLPAIRPSMSNWGNYKGLPLCSVSGDQQAVSFALCGEQEKGAVLSLGTVGAFIIPTGAVPRRENGFITRVGWSKRSAIRYQLEGTVNSCGAIMEMIMTELKLVSSYSELEERVRRGQGKISAFLPFGGTPSPEWSWKFPCVVKNWREASIDDLCCAFVEGLGCFLVELIEKMRPFCADLSEMHLAGGISSCRYLLEFVSSCLEIDPLVEDGLLSGATGAALMAMKSCGVNSPPRYCTPQRIHCNDKEPRRRYENWLEFCRLVRDRKFPHEWLFATEEYLKGRK